jgi:hypothetical protein
MALGHDFSQDANGFTISNPADHFASSDQFAYVINLPARIGTTQPVVLLVKELNGGAESVVWQKTMPVSNPDFNSFANKLQTSVLMAGSAPGTYKLELSDGSSIRAQATFTYNG